jgi:hypothetical protein
VGRYDGDGETGDMEDMLPARQVVGGKMVVYVRTLW